MRDPVTAAKLAQTFGELAAIEWPGCPVVTRCSCAYGPNPGPAGGDTRVGNLCSACKEYFRWLTACSHARNVLAFCAALAPGSRRLGADCPAGTSFLRHTRYMGAMGAMVDQYAENSRAAGLFPAHYHEGWPEYWIAMRHRLLAERAADSNAGMIRSVSA
jgi:hypothetical protein